MKSHELIIQGMNCGHCVMHVKNALSSLAGIEIEEVQIGKARIKYDEATITQELLKTTIDEAGYKLISIK